MTRILLINEAEAEETRAALIEEGRLEEYRCERSASVKLLGNIYQGRVKRVLPGMLLDDGFSFRHGDVTAALRATIG